MKRQIFDDEHEAFREMVRTFLAKEVTPHQERWERAGIVDRETWLAAGRQGLLGLAVEERFGGGGADDYRYGAVLCEEFAKAAARGFAVTLHNDVIGPYLTALGTEEQKRRWLPGFCSGELITAIAMTEPGAGSDLQGIRATATDEGDHWLLNGAKTFISNGILADLVVVVARTTPEGGSKGLSLLVVERGMPGFERGRNLDKIGHKAQDTAELFFTDVRVPKENLLGRLHGGFGHLMAHLPQERLSIAVGAAASAEHVLELTQRYVREREAFGGPLAELQHVRFEIAEMATECAVTRAFVDRCVADHAGAHAADHAGGLDGVQAAMAKWWATELQKRVADRCLQLHGGYGYMTEYPVARAFTDARLQTIYGGTTEIMKEVIGRSLLADRHPANRQDPQETP
ncbi:acyl-CoA dehydrogenase family protein [Streptomyces sp. SBT349]|uniref:acyl-CoA dehydrogenase family protein n=1 Tax=Streptomyces sp. SBT349 TaxID=1580539 RepID=UPI00066D0E65|nr:acyl-CoA dehydrogenase family protein [Streptomyces sp. SBT349]